MKVALSVLTLCTLSFFFLTSGAGAAECQQAVAEALAVHKDVGAKVNRMRRLHMTRKMLSMKAMAALDKDLKTVARLVGEASGHCEKKEAAAANKKTAQAMELAKSVDARHMKMMKMGKRK